MNNFEKVVNKWGEEQIAYAVKMLADSGKNTSKSLSNSLKLEVKETAKGILLTISENEYGEYVRKGVKGATSSKRAPDSPYSFKDKMPPAAPLDRWVVQKGLKSARDKKGRFIKRKSLVFLIRRSIFRFGIKPLDYFDKLKPNIKKLRDDITRQQINDLSLLIVKALNDNRKE